MFRRSFLAILEAASLKWSAKDEPKVKVIQEANLNLHELLLNGWGCTGRILVFLVDLDWLDSVPGLDNSPETVPGFSPLWVPREEILGITFFRCVVESRRGMFGLWPDRKWITDKGINGAMQFVNTKGSQLITGWDAGIVLWAEVATQDSGLRWAYIYSMDGTRQNDWLGLPLRPNGGTVSLLPPLHEPFVFLSARRPA